MTSVSVSLEKHLSITTVVFQFIHPNELFSARIQDCRATADGRRPTHTPSEQDEECLTNTTESTCEDDDMMGRPPARRGAWAEYP